MASAELPYLEHGYIFDTYASLHTFPVTFLANYHGVESDRDMVAYIKRVAAFAPLLDQSVARAEQAAAKGIRPPRFAFDSVIEQSRGVISGTPFDDPYNDFGRLTAEIWRAIRLVVDTGLHAKRWSEEQAVQYMLANSATPEPSVRAEVRRYLVKPGQATSYKAGMLKIQALRAQAEQTLGDRFDIRGFHDTVLGGGAVPLWVLEDMVNDWITVQQAASGPAG